jgi:hypothetical protein
MAFDHNTLIGNTSGMSVGASTAFLKDRGVDILFGNLGFRVEKRVVDSAVQLVQKSDYAERFQLKQTLTKRLQRFEKRLLRGKAKPPTDFDNAASDAILLQAINKVDAV